MFLEPLSDRKAMLGRVSLDHCFLLRKRYTIALT